MYFRHKSRRWATTLVSLLVALVLTACGDTAATIAPVATSQVTASANSTKEMPPVKVAIGFTAPDFTAQTINGETVQLNLLRGKGVIVNFWSVY